MIDYENLKSFYVRFMSNLCESSDLRIVKKMLLVYEIESKIREVFVNICKLVHEYIIHISDILSIYLICFCLIKV